MPSKQSTTLKTQNADYDTCTLIIPSCMAHHFMAGKTFPPIRARYRLRAPDVKLKLGDKLPNPTPISSATHSYVQWS